MITANEDNNSFVDEAALAAEQKRIIVRKINTAALLL